IWISEGRFGRVKECEISTVSISLIIHCFVKLSSGNCDLDVNGIRVEVEAKNWLFSRIIV
ncbi:hypothetical protein PpSQ1_26925, partial [Pseudomonas putida]